MSLSWKGRLSQSKKLIVSWPAERPANALSACPVPVRASPEASFRLPRHFASLSVN
jgi:hypothetical protein